MTSAVRWGCWQMTWCALLPALSSALRVAWRWCPGHPAHATLDARLAGLTAAFRYRRACRARRSPRTASGSSHCATHRADVTIRLDQIVGDPNYGASLHHGHNRRGGITGITLKTRSGFDPRSCERSGEVTWILFFATTIEPPPTKRWARPWRAVRDFSVEGRIVGVGACSDKQRRSRGCWVALEEGRLSIA